MNYNINSIISFAIETGDDNNQPITTAAMEYPTDY